jgi:hypothetical protein
VASSPRLTVIVPTRQRHDTLRSTLRSCVTQDSDALDILVSDNASTPETREVVESFDDPRIRYVNPGRRLSMSEHWDFALSHVDDGYVTFLGDDDGMMPDAAGEIVEVVGSQDADALIWPLATYYWPQFFDRALANCLSMRLPQRGRLEHLDSADVLRRIATFEVPHYWLPSPYWGAVRRACLAGLGGSTGQIFRSITPDIYSGVGVASVTTSYLRTDRIMTLSGSSKHSNGASQITGKDIDSAESPVTMFEAENTIPFHPDLDYAPNIPVLVAECLLQAREHLGDRVPEPELATMFRAALTHPDHVLSPAVQHTVIETMRRTAQRRGVGEQFEAILRTETRRAPARRAAAALRLIALGNPLYDCAADGVDDIAGASVLAGRLRDEHSSAASAAAWTVAGRFTKARRALAAARARDIV